jgi:DNA-binding MarR family transcriptional regulator
MEHSETHSPFLRLIALAQLELTEQMHEAFAAHGFGDQRLAHHRVMPHVPAEGIRLVDLADRAGLTKQAMAELVGELERLGYLARTPDPADGRAKVIRFTERGWSAVEVALDFLGRMESDLAAKVGARKVGIAREVLLTLIPDQSSTQGRGT